MLTAYLLSASIATPLLGRVGDVVGKTRMLVITLVVLTIGSLLAALAPSIGWLIAARVVQGVGGGVLPLAFGIARDEFGAKVTSALSVLASLTAVGFGVGIVVAGPIVDAFGYQGLFWVPMVDHVAGCRRGAPLRPGVTGAHACPAAAAPGGAARRLAGRAAARAQRGQPARAGPPPRSSPCWPPPPWASSAWVQVELRVPVPMIDMAMMRRRGIWTANAVAGLVGFGMFASFAFVPQFLQTPEAAGYGFGASISESGRLLLPSAVMSFLMGFTTATLVHRFGARLVIFTGATIVSASYLGLAFFHDATWQLYLATTVQGLGSGLVFSSLAGVVIASVPAEQTGVASGMNANIRTIGGAVGSAMMAGVVTAHVGASGFPVERGYTVGFAILAGCLLLAAGCALLIPDSHDQPTEGRLADADNAELSYLPAASGPGPVTDRSGARSAAGPDGSASASTRT